MTIPYTNILKTLWLADLKCLAGRLCNYSMFGVIVCRFVKIAGVFYIQVEQAEAGRLGYTNASTIHWKPIDRRIDLNKWVPTPAASGSPAPIVSLWPNASQV